MKAVKPEQLSRIRHTEAWRRLSEQVRQEEPTCRLQLPGCTRLSETADHIIPVSVRPDLALVRSNCQGACQSCNRKRGNLPLSTYREPQALGFFDTEE
jgi:5-methylcytosine-specific restriction endonuclease McrA